MVGEWSLNHVFQVIRTLEQTVIVRTDRSSTFSPDVIQTDRCVGWRGDTYRVGGWSSRRGRWRCAGGATVPPGSCATPSKPAASATASPAPAGSWSPRANPNLWETMSVEFVQNKTMMTTLAILALGAFEDCTSTKKLLSIKLVDPGARSRAPEILDPNLSGIRSSNL